LPISDAGLGALILKLGQAAKRQAFAPGGNSPLIEFALVVEAKGQNTDDK
jgi:hypothetical protein